MTRASRLGWAIAVRSIIIKGTYSGGEVTGKQARFGNRKSKSTHSPIACHDAELCFLGTTPTQHGFFFLFVGTVS
jgi:hypothetical protein